MLSKRSKHGISYVLEVVMVALVVMAMSSGLLFWGLDQVGTSRTQLNSAVRARTDRIQERIVTEDVAWLDSTKLRVYVRNVGSIQAVVDQIYIDHQAGTLTNAKGAGSSATRLSLAVQEVNYIEVTKPAGMADLAIGQTHEIRVATNRGTITVATWTL